MAVYKINETAVTGPCNCLSLPRMSDDFRESASAKPCTFHTYLLTEKQAGDIKRMMASGDVGEKSLSGYFSGVRPDVVHVA